MAAPPAGRSVPAMFTNVIAGVDGAGGGQDAAALAGALGRGRITLVGVYPHDPVRSRGSVAGYEALQAADTLADLEAVRSAAGVDAEVRAIPDNLPARALHQVAEEDGADLIVLGSAHHGRIGRVLLGDVARGVLHDAPCAVAVAPKGLGAVAPQRILVGYDGTPEADLALALARDLAADHGAALTVCVAWENPSSPIITTADTRIPMERLSSEVREEAQSMLDAVMRDLPPQTDGRLLHGPAAQVLEDAAQTHDLLVVGSRRVGTFARVALGSTSDHLVHHAPCPVLVVPRPAQTGPPPIGRHTAGHGAVGA
jgi:nucleotide-binding universal stress UspA family protein